MKVSIKYVKVIRYALISMFCATAFLGQAFSQETDGQLYLYPRKSAIWVSPIISVCWENPTDEFSKEMDLVKESIKNSWQKETAVNFIGWAKCNNASRGVRIQIKDEGPHTKGLGSWLDGKENGMLLNFQFNNWGIDCKHDKDRCIKLIAIHEFGHALGFAHEQNRPDTPETQLGIREKWCVDERQGTDGDILIGNWDLHSVMNYCNPQWAGDGKLSQTDIDGARKMYGTKNETGTFLYISPFDGTTFGASSEKIMVSAGYGWRGWSWNGTTASYLAVNSEGKTILYICPFDGKTFGSVSATYTVSSADGWRGWSWNGTTASYLAVNSEGKTILYICPFDGKTFGPVSATHTVSSADGWRGWSWDGSTTSYIAVKK